jgi:hypothetical protein
MRLSFTIRAFAAMVAVTGPRGAHAQGVAANATTPPSAPGDSAHFPVVDGSNLEGRRFTLPTGFEGDWNVAIVAFRREQQADVDTWTAPLAAMLRGRPDVSTYELPTLTRSYRWLRPMIDGGMARGIPDQRTREHTITLYIDKTPFKRALAIPDEERIRVFLVGRAGRVYWRAAGRWTAEAGDSLRAVLDAVAASSPDQGAR